MIARFATVGHMVAPLPPDAFCESAREFAETALAAHHARKYRRVAIDAGTALEHLAKACLAKRSPGLLAEMKDEASYHSLSRLLGITGGKTSPRPLRTVGLWNALKRARTFVTSKVAEQDLRTLADMRDGTVHAAENAEVEQLSPIDQGVLGVRIAGLVVHDGADWLLGSGLRGRLSSRLAAESVKIWAIPPAGTRGGALSRGQSRIRCSGRWSRPTPTSRECWRLVDAHWNSACTPNWTFGPRAPLIEVRSGAAPIRQGGDAAAAEVTGCDWRIFGRLAWPLAVRIGYFSETADGRFRGEGGCWARDRAGAGSYFEVAGVSSDQAVPFQCSIRVRGLDGLPRFPKPPTAMQSAALVQAILLRLLLADGLGLGTMDQAVPSQCSIRVLAPSALPGGLCLPPAPTAVQSEGLVQLTPASPFAGGPGGLGLGTMAHRVPFQCSVRVCSRGPP